MMEMWLRPPNGISSAGMPQFLIRKPWLATTPRMHFPVKSPQVCMATSSLARFQMITNTPIKHFTHPLFQDISPFWAYKDTFGTKYFSFTNSMTSAIYRSKLKQYYNWRTKWRQWWRPLRWAWWWWMKVWWRMCALPSIAVIHTEWPKNWWKSKSHLILRPQFYSSIHILSFTIASCC